MHVGGTGGNKSCFEAQIFADVQIQVRFPISLEVDAHVMQISTLIGFNPDAALFQPPPGYRPLYVHTPRVPYGPPGSPAGPSSYAPPPAWDPDPSPVPAGIPVRPPAVTVFQDRTLLVNGVTRGRPSDIPRCLIDSLAATDELYALYGPFCKRSAAAPAPEMTVGSLMELVPEAATDDPQLDAFRSAVSSVDNEWQDITFPAAPPSAAPADNNSYYMPGAIYVEQVTSPQPSADSPMYSAVSLNGSTSSGYESDSMKIE